MGMVAPQQHRIVEYGGRRDAAPVDGFRGQLAAALDAAPAPVAGLYLGRRHPEYIQSGVARAVLDAHTSDAH